MRTPKKIFRPANVSPARGLTLLEMVLALALSAVIFVSVGLVSSWHVQMVDERYHEVVEAQIARVVLQRIRRDLRNVVVAADASGLESSQQGGGAADPGSDDGLGDSEAAMEGTGDATETADASATDDLTLQESLPETPGIYGNLTQLQVDTQYVPSLGRILLRNPESLGGYFEPTYPDAETVVYFVSTSDPATSVGAAPSSPDAPSGGPQLMRMSIPRASADFQFSLGGGQDAWQNAQVVAPEIQAVEFSYFDGDQWVDTWDSEVNSGLPYAVEVFLWVNATATADDRPPVGLKDALTSGMLTVNQSKHVYSTIVAFQPAAVTTGEQELEADEAVADMTGEIDQTP